MDKKDAKNAVLNYFLYGVHKELMGKHHAFEKCIHEAMEDYAKFENSNLIEQNEKCIKLLNRILELKDLWLPKWTEDPPIEHLDEAIALRSMEKRCRMLIEKAQGPLKKETKKE